MQKPTIHLNGTSAESLLNQNLTAAQALRNAIKALGEAAPHGRDYYPQGPSAYDKAREEHDARMEKLVDVLSDLEALAEHAAEFVK